MARKMGQEEFKHNYIVVQTRMSIGSGKQTDALTIFDRRYKFTAWFSAPKLVCFPGLAHVRFHRPSIAHSPSLPDLP